MIQHYLLTAWRNLKRNRLLSVIQIFCLTLGLATFMLIIRYVQYEQNWDKFNENFERIYRVQLSWKDNRDMAVNQTSPVTASYLQENFPEVEKAIVIREVWGGYLSTSPERTFYEEEGYYAPNELFDIFSFELLTGNPKNALELPYSIVLSETLAKKYFPGEDPMGKTIFDDRNKEYKVTGIMKDIPENSHITPDYLFSISTRNDWDFTKWGNKNYRTYVLLNKNVNISDFNSRIKLLLDEKEESNQFFMYLKPLTELHLNPNDIKDLSVVIIFYTIIGVLILLLASLNFANLTTAFSISRAKEIGVRKVNGGGTNSLRQQFLSESILLALIAMFFAILLARLSLPLFNHVVQRNLTLNFFSNPWFLTLVIGSTLVTGIISGIYPAFLLSGFKPVVILKGNNPLTKNNGKITGLKTLVTIQFVITVILLATTVWTFRQTEFLKNKNLGFDKSQLFHVSLPPNNSERNFDEIKALALRIQGVENITISRTTPFHSNWSQGVEKEGASPNEWINFIYNEVSPEFMDTYNLKLAEGSFFSESQKSDEKACVINKSAVKSCGWESALGKKLKLGGEWYNVIGVVEDFHVNSVMWNIQPYIMKLYTGDVKSGYDFTFRLNGNNNQHTIAELDNLFRTSFPNSIFTISYFDDRSNKGDIEIWQSVGKTFVFFTILAILIAAVGLFGMVAYTTRKRLKEIGIRRVQGANSLNIVFLVVKDFLFLLLIANVFVFPVPFILEKTTPGNFKYQMESWEFIAIIGISLIIAVLSSGYEAIKAANMNPVKSIRYE
jgi:putative ABC transport system permease protein